MKGETPRVARLVRAYQMLADAGPKVSLKRIDLLECRLRAVLPQLSQHETAAYYAAIKLVREWKWSPK